jgi:hypothetical protein
MKMIRTSLELDVRGVVYHFGMQSLLHWLLVFTTDSLEHLEERDIDADDVADSVFGRFGPARVRRAGRGIRTRWFVIGPVRGGALLTCVFRMVESRDLLARGVFVLTPGDVLDRPLALMASMRMCVSARMSDRDEICSYRAWRKGKGMP